LSALVGLVLLIACFNATGMLLARGVTRAPELGMRLALGAARGRVVRLLVVESLGVSLAGAIVGLWMAWGVIGLIERAIPLMPNFDFSIESRHRLACDRLLLRPCGGDGPRVRPWSCAGGDPRGTGVNAQPRRAGAAPRLRARSVFVVAQIALSVLLVVCALLLTRSIRHASQIDPASVLRASRSSGSTIDWGIRQQAGTSVCRRFHDADSGLAGTRGGGVRWVVPLTMERVGRRFWLPG
jgi:ABC-type antimicrobial peptide transport system permease subunit